MAPRSPADHDDVPGEERRVAAPAQVVSEPVLDEVSVRGGVDWRTVPVTHHTRHMHPENQSEISIMTNQIEYCLILTNQRRVLGVLTNEKRVFSVN